MTIKDLEMDCPKPDHDFFLIIVVKHIFFQSKIFFRSII